MDNESLNYYDEKARSEGYRAGVAACVEKVKAMQEGWTFKTWNAAADEIMAALEGLTNGDSGDNSSSRDHQ